MSQNLPLWYKIAIAITIAISKLQFKCSYYYYNHIDYIAFDLWDSS